jgi:hypothetical protein
MKKKSQASSRRTPRARRAPAAELRRDDAGDLWTAAQVMRELAAIVCALDDNLKPADVTRSASFAGDFGWDDWFKLRLRKPVEKRLHESLSAFVIVERVKTVGDLADYVWSSMEAA